MRYTRICRRIWIAAIAATLALIPASAAQAAELVAAVHEPNLDANVVYASPGEVATFTVELSAEGTVGCGMHSRNPAFATIETSYSIVGGVISEGGSPSDPQPFFRIGTVEPPPSGGCRVFWSTHPEPYRLQATVAIAPDTPLGDYPLVLRTTGSGALRDNDPTTITVRVVQREEPPEPPPPPPPQAGVLLPPPVLDLPAPRENVSVNVLPVQGRVLVRYPGSPKPILLDKPIQVPVKSKLDTRSGQIQLVSDKDGKGGVQSASFWNGRFTVGYTRAVVAGARGRRPGSRRRASRPITELTLAKTCAKGASAASAGDGAPLARADRRRRKPRGLFGRGKGRYRTRGSHGAGTVVGTHWYTENRCHSTFFRVFTGVVGVRDFSKDRTVKLRRRQSYLTGSPRSKRG